MDSLMNFISDGMVIVIVATYVMGVFLKKLENIKDKYITSLLMLFGVVIAVLLSIINAQYKVDLNTIVNGILQGILC